MALRLVGVLNALLCVEALALVPGPRLAPVARRVGRVRGVEVSLKAEEASSFGPSGPQDETPEEDSSWLVEGAMVCAQDVHGQWYDAEVVELKVAAGSVAAAFVDYLGWDDWPGEWVPRSRLAYRPPKEMPLADVWMSAEEAAARKEDMMKSQDMWQFQQFSDAFCGSFACSGGERYAADGRALSLVATFDGSLTLERADDASKS